MDKRAFVSRRIGTSTLETIKRRAHGIVDLVDCIICSGSGALKVDGGSWSKRSASAKVRRVIIGNQRTTACSLTSALALLLLPLMSTSSIMSGSC